MIDLALLRALKHKELFDKVAGFIPHSAIDKRTKAIVVDIQKYYEMHPEETKIDLAAFRSLFFTSWHKGLKDEACKYYNKLLTNMEKENSDAIAKSLINQLVELDFATNVGNLVSEYAAGEEVDILEDTTNLCKKAEEQLERSTSFEFADVGDTTIGEVDDSKGLNWHLDCLNATYRKILGGDQYIIAARPGLGKTTFLTHLNASLAQDLADNKIILWFNNESRRQRIMARQIQSALNATDEELRAMKKAGTLTANYVKVMGRGDRVRVYDIHTKSNKYILDIIESVGIDNIGGLVFDMLDNVVFKTAKELREDQRLEELYKWTRELAVRCNCVSLPTSQVSNEGAGLMFPSENMLKDSKTGKQGACDGIIMIGWDEDPLHEHTRGIAMPKTKSKLEGKGNMREEIILDADRGRYIG